MKTKTPIRAIDEGFVIQQKTETIAKQDSSPRKTTSKPQIVEQLLLPLNINYEEPNS